MRVVGYIASVAAAIAPCVVVYSGPSYDPDHLQGETLEIIVVMAYPKDHERGARTFEVARTRAGDVSYCLCTVAPRSPGLYLVLSSLPSQG